jgi:hypothetical protein
LLKLALGAPVAVLAAAQLELHREALERYEALAAALALYDDLARDPPPGIAPGVLLAGPDALRAHLRRERLDPARTALLHVRAGDVRSRHPQWRAAAAHAGLAARRAGPRGLPAAAAPPASAEALARALSTTL